MNLRWILCKQHVGGVKYSYLSIFNYKELCVLDYTLYSK